MYVAARVSLCEKGLLPFFLIMEMRKHTLSVHAGTFAVIELMIGNSLEKILYSDEILSEFCLGGDGGSMAASNSSCVMMRGGIVGNGSGDIDSSIISYAGELTTCSQVKLDVVVTLAFLSGIVMVCVLSCVHMCVFVWVHVCLHAP